MLRESKPRGAGPPRAPGPSQPPDGKRGRARAVLDRPPPGPQGWRTTDDDEIALRRWRGSTEIVAIEALEAERNASHKAIAERMISSAAIASTITQVQVLSSSILANEANSLSLLP
jgi:hypothetical protein